MSKIIAINDILSSRFNDVITSFRQNNALVYVPLQSYLESLIKHIIKHFKKSNYINKRDSLGELLSYKFLLSILRDDLKFNNIDVLRQINASGNDYKHNGLITFDNIKARNYIEESYKLSVFFYNFANKTNIASHLDNQWLELENLSNTMTEVKQASKEILLEEKENLSELRKDYEAQVKQIRKEIADVQRKNIKVSTVSDPSQILALISVKEKEISELELIIENDPNDTLKVKEIQLLEYQIKELRKQEIESRNSESADSAAIRLNVHLKDTEERLSQVILNEKPIDYAIKKTDINPVETINDFSSNFQVSFDSSYEGSSPFTIINTINREYCQSKYESYYAVLYNHLVKGPQITPTPYLNKLGLLDPHLNEVYRLELTILSLVRNGKLNDNVWRINIVNRSIKLLQIAINNIVYKMNRLHTLSNTQFTPPKFDVIRNAPQNDYNNISFDVFYPGIKNMFVIVDTILHHENMNKIWIASRILYDVNNTPIQLSNLQELTFELFGFETFKTGQLEILTNALNGRRTIGILTTGGGKSLIYQFVGLMQPKITIVVDPINALVFDQVRKLTGDFNITRIEKIISGQEKTPLETISAMKNNPPLFAFASPERFQNKEFRDLLIALNARESIGLITLDEVHCLSEWGHDFRVAYLMLVSTINQYCKGIQYLGLTATAAINVIKDLQVELGISNPDHIIYSKKLQRDNLDFEIIKVRNRIEFENALDEMLDEDVFKDDIYNFNTLDNKNGYIVFCKTVTEVNNFYQKYAAKFGERVSKFHGNFRDHFESFLTNQSSLMFTTKAFGMGIDKPNIRKTVHYGIPSSRENYFQEAGRGGRDNQPTKCILLTHETDVSVLKLENEFLNLNTSYERLFTIQEQLGKKYSDLSTNAFFLVTGIRTIDEEIQNVIEIYQKLAQNENLIGKISIDKNQINEVEQYLYVLHKIGMIRNWEVKYIGQRNDLTIYLHPLHDDFDHVKSVSYNYISQYPSSRNELEQLQQLTSFIEIEALIRIVRTWYHKTFVRSKREQLANMVEFVKRLSGSNRNMEIQNELSQFFDISKLLENSSSDSLRFEKASIKDSIKRVKNMKEEQLVNTRITMERLLETEESISINIFTSLVNLRLNEFDSRNGRERFQYTLKQMNEVEVQGLFDYLPILYKDLSEKQQIILLNELYAFNKEKLFNSTLLDFASEATDEMIIRIINSTQQDLFD